MLLSASLILIGLVMVGGFVLGWQSQSPPGLGLLNGHLQPCSDKPNCVSSEAEKGDKLHVIAPFSGTDWQGLRRVIEASGGKIVLDHGAYMHATFTSSLFRFVDDVELRLDAAQELIHVRSASRVGHSDFGVNRERVEAIRLRLGEARP